jgi:hypothetical protein
MQQRAVLAAVLFLGAGCSLFGTEEATGTFASANAVVYAATDSVTFRLQCSRVSFANSSLPIDGSFVLRGVYGGLNQPGAVTVSGTVAGSAITFELRPGRSGSGSEDFSVMRNAAVPDWYPDKATCVA